MAKKPTLNDITISFADVTQLNQNWDRIETAFENTLSRDGSTPNTMLADIDLNGNDLLNVGSINGSTDLATTVARGTIEEYVSFSRAEVATRSIDSSVDAIRVAGYTTAGDGGGGLYKRVSVEPSHAGKVQSNDGAWWEYVPEEGRVNVMALGATGDGTTDDGQAIVDAEGVRASLGGVLLFPAGTYAVKTGRTLAIPANGRWRGANMDETTISLEHADAVVTFDDRSSIDDLKIDGTSTATTCLKNVSTAARCNFRNLWITSAATNGILLSNCWILSFFGCVITNCGTGVQSNNSLAGPTNNINFHGGEIQGNTKGVRFDGAHTSRAINFFGTAIEGNTQHGVYINSVIHGLHFSGAYFEDNGIECEILASCLDITFSGGFMSLGTAASDKGVVCSGGNSKGFVFENVTVRLAAGSSATVALDFQATATVFDATLISNQYESGLTIVNNMSSGFNLTSINDGLAGTKIPGIDSIGAGGEAVGNNFAGEVTFGSVDTTKAVSFGTAEPDANYFPFISPPSWDPGSVWITSKTTAGFTINFTNARGSGSENVMWQIVRR